MQTTLYRSDDVDGSVCIGCKVNHLVDARGGSQYKPGTRVLLCELDDRADLNGFEGVLVSPATQSEESELRYSQLLKVQVGDETLVIPLNNVIVGALPVVPLNGTKFCSLRHSVHGLGVFAIQNISAGSPVLVEHPLVAINSHPLAWLDHPKVGPLIEQVTTCTRNQETLRTDHAPPEASDLVDQILSIQATEALDRLSEPVQRRLYSLLGALLTDPF